MSPYVRETHTHTQSHMGSSDATLAQLQVTGTGVKFTEDFINKKHEEEKEVRVL